MSLRIEDFGYSPFFEDHFRSIGGPGEVPARVLEERRGRYRIVRRASDGSVVEEDAQPSGTLRLEAESSLVMPTTGDWVSAKANPGGPATLRSILPRKSAFIRKAPGEVDHDRIDAQVVAANVDAVYVVAAAGSDWNLRRIERYITLSRAAGVEPILVVAKADLSEDPAALLAEAAGVAPGVEALTVCALHGRGIAELASGLRPGRTIALIGSSGAGKSTLLNALAGEELARTNAVRFDDQRGRHTTTHRQLYRLGSGALVIDTPGMRELQLWAEAEDVDAAFPEIEALAESCRFRDCRHAAEPGCAVRAALEGGRLDEARYQSWRKLGKEAAFLKTKEDYSARLQERRKWRSIEMSRRSFAKAEARTSNEGKKRNNR